MNAAHVGIRSANRLKVSEAICPGPNVRETLHGRFRTIQLGQVLQKTVDYQTVETVKPLITQGSVQPLSSRQLALKKEGTRQWDWRMVHTTTDLALQPNDLVIYRGVRFTVMGQWDYRDNGYYQYELVNSYGNRIAS